jgi:cellulose biosynthesis protein BcsQ
MRVSVGVLESELSYAERLLDNLTDEYPDEIEVSLYSTVENALVGVRAKTSGVLLISESWANEMVGLPKRVALGVLVDDPSVTAVDGVPAICRYTKLTDIYNGILRLYETVATGIELASNGEDSPAIVFTSPAGGVGTSTIALAFSMSMARQGRQVLYLDLSDFADPDLILTGEGQGSLTDVIFAAKSSQGNFALSARTNVKRDSESGLYYFGAARTPVDMLEFAEDERAELCKSLLTNTEYDLVAVDLPFSFAKSAIFLFERAFRTVLVSDGRALSNDKVGKALRSLEILRERGGNVSLARFGVFYNRFSSKNSGKIDTGLPEFGGVGRIEGLDERSIIREVSHSARLDGLMGLESRNG